MKRWTLAIALFYLMAAASAFALTDNDAHDATLEVTEVALIDLNSTALITLTTGTPATAGDPPPGDTDATKRLFYTAVNGDTLTRTITVQSSAAAPAGTGLTVQATVEVGAGTGSTQNISTTASQVLVTAISNVATGTTGTDGAGLTYTFSVTTLADLVAGATVTPTITYTLTEDA